MAPRANKRPSTDSLASTLEDIPRAKRLRSWKKKHSPLMELPTEIRLRILQELLWQQESLKITRETDSNCICFGCSGKDKHPPARALRQSSFAFSPAILRTCRILHQEGVSLLYNNTFACELWYDDDNDFEYDDGPYVSSFLRPDWNISGTHLRMDGSKRFYTSAYLMKNVKRLEVVVRVLGDEGCSSTRQLVRKFVPSIQKLVALSHLKVRLDLPSLPVIIPWVDTPRWLYENREITRDDYKDQALGPFALLRRLKSVEFDGVDVTIAKELKTIMTGDAPAVDFARMHESLNKYTFGCVQYKHCLVCRMVIRYLERAEHAADMEDETAFKQARSKVFSLITEHQEQERAKACQFDVVKEPSADEAKVISLLPERAYHSANADNHDADVVSLETGDGSEWKAHMKLDWERRNEETDEDRLRRAAEERHRPSLIRLREIVRWERDESPWARG